MDEDKMTRIADALWSLAAAQAKLADEAKRSNDIAERMATAQEQTLASSAALEKRLMGYGNVS